MSETRDIDRAWFRRGREMRAFRPLGLAELYDAAQAADDASKIEALTAAMGQQGRLVRTGSSAATRMQDDLCLLEGFFDYMFHRTHRDVAAYAAFERRIEKIRSKLS